ncbi:MAG: hypothetical protein AAF390_18985 [Pseudomonadota bacterium]
MDGKTELDARIARLEAALEATSAALEAAEARPDPGAAMVEAETELAKARARIEELEAETKAVTPSVAPAAEGAPTDGAEANRLRAAVEALTATSAELRAQADGASDKALEAEVEALRAARALDLAEMEAILAELGPLLGQGEEGAHA